MEPTLVYSVSMKWLILAGTMMLTGCAYTAVSTATYLTTGKSIGDHAATVATGADCDATRYVIGKQAYWCEVAREPGTTYNRNEY